MGLLLVTDSSCDLPLEIMEEGKLMFLPITVRIFGKEIPDDLGQTISSKEFYQAVRDGEIASTSQVNVHEYYRVFRECVDAGNSVIYIGFTSALSGTFNSSVIARQMVVDETPTADITVIDTLSASMGEGLLVYYAKEMLMAGKSKEEIIGFIEGNIQRTNHYFTVDDLKYLQRSGRVSKTAATIGTMLNIKPVLHVNEEGKLIPLAKVKGRKKSLHYLADKCKERISDPQDQMIFISHGDCLEDAEFIKKEIESELSVKGFLINNIGPGVGSHSGPGTVAIFFFGETRE